MATKVITSAITAKSRTVIPREIREKLGLTPGDRLRYVETKHGIIIKREREPEDDPFVTFTEWASDADEEAYADL